MNKLVLVFLLSAAITLAAGVDCPPDDIDGEASYYPHETDCWKFYECFSGRAAVLECAPGTYFDPKLDVCDKNVDCGTLLTSTNGPGPSPTPPPAPTDAPAPSSEAAEH